MGCNPITFHNVTPSVFACMKNKLTEAGIPVPPGNEGDMQGQGVKAHFKWDGVANLTITVTDKPWIVSCGTVIGKIQDFVHSCGGTNLSNIKGDYSVYEEKFAMIKDKLSKDPVGMQAFFENPKIMLEQTGIPRVEDLITQYQSASEDMKFQSASEEIKVNTKWWGLDFIMNEELTQKIITGQIASEALAGLISASLLAAGIAQPLAVAVGAAFAAILVLKYVELRIVDNGKGVHWPITWLQWAALILPPWDVASLTVKGAVLIHPVRN